MKDSDIIRLARERRALAALSCPAIGPLGEAWLAYAEELLGKERVEEALKVRQEMVDRIEDSIYSEAPPGTGIPYWITKPPEPDVVAHD